MRLPGEPLAEDRTIDVAVVGGGVSGALITDAVLRTGKSVAVIDRRGLVRGSSPASTALLQFEIDQPLTVFTGKTGRKRAVRAYWRFATAVGFLGGRIADLGRRCSFREWQTVYLPGNVLNVRELEAEARARAEVGLRSRFIDVDELHELTGIERPGAILSCGAGEARSRRTGRGFVALGIGARRAALRTNGGRRYRAASSSA